MAVNRDPAIVQALTALAGALSPLAQAVTTKEGGTTQQIPRSLARCMVSLNKVMRSPWSLHCTDSSMTC